MAEKAQGLRLAFGCQKRVGKDTACEYLKKQHGGHILSFAQPLYEIMNSTQNKLNLPKKKNREFLRMVGMWARKQNEDVWVDYLINQLNKIPIENNVFISDVRFENEMEALKDNGFTLIRILRFPDNLDDIHISENSLLNADWNLEIENNGTIENFHYSLDGLI